jgi:hypothetical protein
MHYKSLIIIAVVFSFLFSETLNAQKIISAAKTKTVTPTKKIPKEKEFTKMGLRAGANISVVYLARNTKDNNNVPGFCGGFVYEINDFVRTSGLYSNFKPLNIEPTWYDVKANTYELNLEVLAKFPNKKTLLYPFAGVSYNTFKGFFTGQSDYLNLQEYYPLNSTVKSNWFGVNLGTGLEHNFGILGVFIDYRMRVGRQDKALNIMDVCYTGGLKVRFPYGKLAYKLGHLNDKYTWF